MFGFQMVADWERIPPFKGVAYLAPEYQMAVCYYWPINIFVGLFRHIWYTIRDNHVGHDYARGYLNGIRDYSNKEVDASTFLTPTQKKKLKEGLWWSSKDYERIERALFHQTARSLEISSEYTGQKLKIATEVGSE